ncbi:MAG TPA: amino acid ABC transporter permease [Rhodobacter sp.]|nr:amino acid ABC transporter permease [Rhodobacter sp.]
MLAPQSAPVTERGAVKWLRENLFSSIGNSVLTILGLLVLFWIVQASLPWLLNGVWQANSLGECRTIIAATAGEGASGACWAMIAQRWNQFMFGFYPKTDYWRPILSFALMFVALTPVLYYGLRRAAMLMVGTVGVLAVLSLALVQTDGWHDALVAAVMLGLFAVAAIMPKKLVWVTLVFPAVGFFLLWGGSVWGPVGTLFGFGIWVAIWLVLQSRLGVVVPAAIGLVAASLWWLVLQTSVTTALHGIAPLGLTAIDSDQFGGFLLAFVIGVTAISASLPIGILLALGRQSDMLLIKTLSVGFIEFVRGVPLITMLFTASLLLQYFLPPRTNFDLILRVIILVSLFASAYIAEVIRGGLAALPRGQYEAADALGLDYWQAQRLIIMPQALKISIPGIVSSFIGLFKDTTLVALVGLADPLQGITKIVRADIAWKGIYWEPFIFVGAIFFLFCFGMSRYSMYLERKLKTDHR